MAYKINALFISSENPLNTLDGIRIQQRVDCLSTQVAGLANEQARLAEVVHSSHNTLATTNQGIAGLSESMLTHSQLLDGVIQVLVNNPEFMATARQLQQGGFASLPRITP